MPAKRPWTREHDTHIATSRAARRPWDGIAADLLASRSAVIDRARALHVPPLPPLPRAPPEEPANREPLAPGHPTAWAVLTEASLLAATPYPFPPIGSVQ